MLRHLVSLLLLSHLAFAEKDANLTLVARDGSKIEGTLVEVTANKIVVFKRTSDGEEVRVNARRLSDETLAEVTSVWEEIQAAAAPAEAAAADDNGARWKIAYFIFPKLDLDLGGREIKSEMSPERLKQFTDNGAMMDRWIMDWSGGMASVHVEVFVMDEPLTSMSPLRGSWWPAINDVDSIIGETVRDGLYDSVVIGIDNKAYRPNYAGLGIVAMPNRNPLRATYALTTNPWDETFIHEWMHGANTYVREGLKVDCPDPHANGELGIGKQNGGWKHWYKMLLSGTAPRGEGKTCGFTQEAWDQGGPHYAKRSRRAK